MLSQTKGFQKPGINGDSIVANFEEKTIEFVFGGK